MGRQLLSECFVGEKKERRGDEGRGSKEGWGEGREKGREGWRGTGRAKYKRRREGGRIKGKIRWLLNKTA